MTELVEIYTNNYLKNDSDVQNKKFIEFITNVRTIEENLNVSNNEYIHLCGLISICHLFTH